MFPLLFALAVLEMSVLLGLLFETPVRNLLMLALRRLKRGRGLLVARTVAATFAVVFFSALSGVGNFQRRAGEGRRMNPTDEVLMGNRLLETLLMGFCLFLYMLIDRLHYYMGELLETQTKRCSQLGGHSPDQTNPT